MNLLLPSKRAESLRSTSLAILSILPVMEVYIFTMRPLGNFLATVGLAFAWAIVGVYVLAFLPSIIGLGYLLDYLFLKIEPRYSKVVAVLKLKDVNMGIFRHSLNCVVEEQPFGQKYKGKELQLTVAATRRGLKAALGSMTQPASTGPDE